MRCGGPVQWVEVVHHLAALIPQRRADPETMRAVNVGGTKNVLDAARAAGVRRVVFLSSVEVFGVPAIVPCPEDGPLAPLGEYGRNKIAAEALCREAAAQGLEVVILRPPTIVGPGLEEPFLVGLMAAIRDGRPVTLLGDGRNRFQFVHAEDVVSACLLAADHPAAVGEVFHIGSADVPPIREMVETVIARYRLPVQNPGHPGLAGAAGHRPAAPVRQGAAGAGTCRHRRRRLRL
jgi:nucleoside-diphosphate-sugar epimerase